MAGNFLAAIHQEEDGGEYGVSFPDFPGCISAGRTIDLALRNAAEALRLHFDGMKEDGDPLVFRNPDQMYLAIPHRGDDPTLVGIYWIDPELAPADRSIRVNVTLPRSLVDEIDTVAGERGRSAFLADGARWLLHEKRAEHHKREAAPETSGHRKRAAG